MVTVALGSAPVGAQDQPTPLPAARAVFDGLQPIDKLLLQLLLQATGDLASPASSEFYGGLADAVANFQRRHDLPATGVLTATSLRALQDEGGTILGAWALHIVDHPQVNAALLVPGGRFRLIEKRTRRGLAFENDGYSFSIDFSFFSEADRSLATIFEHLTAAAPGKHVTFKALQEGGFAVATAFQRYDAYSRYSAMTGGSIGFTAKWDRNLYPNGFRVAMVMASGLFAEPSGLRSGFPGGTEPWQAMQLKPEAPAEPPPQADQTAAQPSAAAKPQASTSSAGSAFFVSGAGDLLTNHHVIKGCGMVTVVGRGPARIVAADPRNDLALLRLETRPADVASVKAAVFRSQAMQLGEAVYVLGFPYANALDNGVIFTNGLVSSVAGIENDTTNFQMTAPVQPGSSGGPVLDQSGNLAGVVVARLSDSVIFTATHAIPQNVNFGIKAEIAASFLRAHDVTPQVSGEAPPLAVTQIAALGKTMTVQVTCDSRHAD